VVSDALMEQEYRFRGTCREFTSPVKWNSSGGQQKSSHGAFQYDTDQYESVPLSPVLHHGTAAAEEIIAMAQNSQCVPITDVCLACPTSGRTSDFPLRFHGCMNCGGPGRASRDCADRNLQDAKYRFQGNVNAQKLTLLQHSLSKRTDTLS
jgi:hypothetical protein